VNRHCERSEAISIKIKKVSLIACLFCFNLTGHGQSFSFHSKVDSAYSLALNLQWIEARSLLSDDVEAIYVQNLCNAMELLINEDKKLFDTYETTFEKSLDKLDQTKKESAELLFVQAELHLQWAFVYLKFGQEFDAAFQLRKANQLAVQCRNQFPEFLPILKTHGVLQVLLGSVPEKYNWLLGIMNMTGDIQNGLTELQTLATSKDPLRTEADITLALIYGYVLQDMAQSQASITRIQQTQSDQALMLFAGASLALKNSEGKQALAMLSKLKEKEIPSVHYFLGEALLCKGEYNDAAKSFLSYAKKFKGESFIKDSYFKTGLCYQLLNQKNKAAYYYALAKKKGLTNTEADKYAARTLLDVKSINAKLQKIRFFTDGGYYAEAQTEIAEIKPIDLRNKKDEVEFYYRKARLAHKTNQWNAAKLFYRQVIDMNGDEPWYFAPNACLQTGYILQQQSNKEGAKKYYQKALSYKKHEYKNSIDSKAKSALAQLRASR
jgi:TolA-binding protein